MRWHYSLISYLHDALLLYAPDLRDCEMDAGITATCDTQGSDEEKGRRERCFLLTPFTGIFSAGGVLVLYDLPSLSLSIGLAVVCGAMLVSIAVSGTAISAGVSAGFCTASLALPCTVSGSALSRLLVACAA